MKLISLKKSTNPLKKYDVVIEHDGREKKVSFGAIHPDGTPYEDYTIHHDEERKQRYIQRHKDKEDWTKSGILTAGFWSRWLLWNKPTIRASLEDIKSRFDL